MARRCLLLDLNSDPALIERYRDWHKPGATPAAVVRAISDAGVEGMEIYQSGDRLFMIMEISADAPADVRADESPDPELKAWEQLMAPFQKPVAWAIPGEKWTAMERIFDLAEHLDRAGAAEAPPTNR